jgi:hypothetical protein
MKQRGRKKVGEVQIAENVAQIPRAAPPSELSAFETEVWIAVTNTKPADWFQADSVAMLRAYCRHVYQAHKIDQQMDEIIGRPFADKEGHSAVGAQFDALTRMRERETRAIMALARSMRLTQQSRVEAKTAATAHRKTIAASGDKALWEA